MSKNSSKANIEALQSWIRQTERERVDVKKGKQNLKK